jgi:hypothetical protein
MKQTVSLECHMANPCSFLLVVIRRAAALAAVLLITGLMAVSADAQTNSTWNGGAGDWGVSTNWNPAVVPEALFTLRVLKQRKVLTLARGKLNQLVISLSTATVALS